MDYEELLKMMDEISKDISRKQEKIKDYKV